MASSARQVLSEPVYLYVDSFSLALDNKLTSCTDFTRPAGGRGGGENDGTISTAAEWIAQWIGFRRSHILYTVLFLYFFSL